jgi:hypothetical protein
MLGRAEIGAKLELPAVAESVLEIYPLTQAVPPVPV